MKRIIDFLLYKYHISSPVIIYVEAHDSIQNKLDRSEIDYSCILQQAVESPLFMHKLYMHAVPFEPVKASRRIFVQN